MTEPLTAEQAWKFVVQVADRLDTLGFNGKITKRDVAYIMHRITELAQKLASLEGEKA